MFESFARVRKTRSRWKVPMLACGALIHTAIFTGMWINGVWQIQKVEAAENELTLSIPAPIPSVERPANASKAPPTPRPRQVAREPTQPQKIDVKVEPVPTVVGDPDGPTGPDDPDALPIGSNLPPVTLPPVQLPPAIKPPPVPPAPRNVNPQVLEQQRIAGDKRILPDDDTAQQIARSGGGEARGVVRLCLDSAGQVRSATIARSTSFPAYDAKLQREMQGWRYQPYQVDGVATPVCTMVTFIYRQR